MVDRESRKRGITARRNEQILNAALEIFSQHGYGAATVPEIAERAGVAIGTIYIYYASKRDLFIAVLRKIIFTVSLTDLVEKMPSTGFPVTFKRIMQHQFNIIASGNVSRLVSLMGEIQRDPELKALFVAQLFQPLISRLEVFFRTRIAAGEFRQLDPAVLVRAMHGMVIGLTILRSLEGEASPLNRLPQDQVADELLDLLLHGLSGQGSKTTSGGRHETN